MKKSKNGKRGSAVTSIGQVPLVISEALALIVDTIHHPENGFDSVQIPLSKAVQHLDGVLTYIFGDDCDLAALKLTEGQREYLRYILDQFAKGEEIEAGKPIPTVVSMV